MPDYQGNHKILRVYMVLGDAVSKLEMFVWILKHISRSITWFLYTLKASYLVKWPISTRSFMWWCQFIDLLKFETRPSSLLNFGMAYLYKLHTVLFIYVLKSLSPQRNSTPFSKGSMFFSGIAHHTLEMKLRALIQHLKTAISSIYLE